MTILPPWIERSSPTHGDHRQTKIREIIKWKLFDFVDFLQSPPCDLPLIVFGRLYFFVALSDLHEILFFRTFEDATFSVCLNIIFIATEKNNRGAPNTNKILEYDKNPYADHSSVPDYESTWSYD